MAYIIGFNDLHLTHRTPVSRTDDWADALFAKLEQIRALAVKLQAPAICMAGDTFHTESVSFQVLTRFISWLISLPCPFLTIPGNHDLLHNRIDSAPRTPFGVLVAAKAAIDVSYQEWGQDGFTVTGVPFPDAQELTSYERLQPFKPDLVMAHCFAEPEARTFFGAPVLAYGDIGQRVPSARYFLFGHDHAEGGIHQLEAPWSPAGKQTFINIGAISRGALTQEDVTRDVTCVLIATKGSEVRRVRLNVAPSSEVFDLQLKAAKDREASQVEAFIASIAEDLTGAAPVDFADRLAALNLPDGVRREALAYIQRAEQEQPTD